MSNFIVNPNLIIIYSHAYHPIRFDAQFQIIDHPHIRYIITISSRMQAPQPGSPSSSNISVEFGEPIQDKCEVDVAIDFFVNSHKNQNLRFNVQEFLNIELPSNSVLIEVESAEDGEELAEKFNQIKKSSQSMKEIQSEKDIKIQCLGKGSKAYIIISGEGIEGILEKLSKKMLEHCSQLGQYEDSVLRIIAQSHNTLPAIFQKMQEKGTLIAFLDSLKLCFNFQNKQFSNSFMANNFGKMFQIPNFENAIKSFRTVQLRIKGQSSSMIENYPEIADPLKLGPLNDDFKPIANLLGDKIKLYLFGKPLSCSATIHAKGLYILLDVLFA